MKPAGQLLPPINPSPPRNKKTNNKPGGMDNLAMSFDNPFGAGSSQNDLRASQRSRRRMSRMDVVASRVEHNRSRRA